MSVTRLGPGAYPIAGHVPQTYNLAIVEVMSAVDTVDIQTLRGIIYQHEIGNDAAGLPLVSSFQTGYFMLQDGEEFSYVDQVIPDMIWGTSGAAQNAQIQITFLTVNFPGDTPIAYGPYALNSTTEYISVRFRARQVAILLESSDLESFWRLGRIRFRFSASGRR